MIRGPTLLWGLLAILGVATFVLWRSDDVGMAMGLTSHDFAQLAALVAILIFLAAGVFGRRLGISEILRSMIAWAAIILVVAGLYASRDELTGFAGRLLGALAPGLPIAGTLTGDGNPDSVAVVRTSGGHFAVRASIENTPVTFLVDTGASFVTLTDRDARRIGINPERLDYQVPIRTASGTLAAANITLADITVGSIQRHNVPALVAPPRTLEQSLLGMTFLDTLDGYAISGDRLVLTP